MDDPENTVPEPANLRFLRRLVTVLTAVMIGGVLVVIALLVTQLNDTAPSLPDRIILPAGTSAYAFTQSRNWYAVVTDTGEILIFDRLTGSLRQRVQVDID